MNALLLAPDAALPSVRYRVRQYIPALEAAGHRVTVAESPRGTLARWRLFRSASAFDVVLLQKRLMATPFIGCLRRRARRLVYDFDDAVLYGSPEEGGLPSATRARRFRRTVAAADRVLAGNAGLAELARPFAREVRLIPTALDPAKYDAAVARRRPAPGLVTLGWIGGGYNIRYVEMLREALETLGARHAHVRLRIISNDFPRFSRLPVEEVPWSEAGEAEALAGIDIGLAPLQEDSWSRGKCGLKLLQYLAAARPVVCSPVGVQREMVEPGVNGYHATTTADWVEALDRLIASAEARARMGAAGRRLLDRRYTVARVAPDFVAALTDW